MVIYRLYVWLSVSRIILSVVCGSAIGSYPCKLIICVILNETHSPLG